MNLRNLGVAADAPIWQIHEAQLRNQKNLRSATGRNERRPFVLADSDAFTAIARRTKCHDLFAGVLPLGDERAALFDMAVARQIDLRKGRRTSQGAIAGARKVFSDDGLRSELFLLAARDHMVRLLQSMRGVLLDGEGKSIRGPGGPRAHDAIVREDNTIDAKLRLGMSAFARSWGIELVFVTEKEGAPDGPLPSNTFVCYIDAVDGSDLYSKSQPEWTSMLGLGIGPHLLVSVVDNPRDKKTYEAIRGYGARRIEHRGGRIVTTDLQVSDRARRDATVELDRGTGPIWDALHDRISVTAKLRSGHGYILIAEGLVRVEFVITDTVAYGTT